jgi:ATP-dependent DNA ligase
MKAVSSRKGYSHKDSTVPQGKRDAKPPAVTGFPSVSARPIWARMLSRPRTLPAGFIQPCLPTKAPRPPSGALWLHEIKHDGFRVIARKDGERVKLYSRPGNDLTGRFPLIVEGLAGCAVACDGSGIAQFNRIRYRRYDGTVFLYAFDLIELNGDDLRRGPLSAQGHARLRSGQGRSRPPP